MNGQLPQPTSPPAGIVYNSRSQQPTYLPQMAYHPAYYTPQSATPVVTTTAQWQQPHIRYIDNTQSTSVTQPTSATTSSTAISTTVNNTPSTNYTSPRPSRSYTKQNFNNSSNLNSTSTNNNNNKAQSNKNTKYQKDDYSQQQQIPQQPQQQQQYPQYFYTNQSFYNQNGELYFFKIYSHLRFRFFEIVDILVSKFTNYIFISFSVLKKFNLFERWY